MAQRDECRYRPVIKTDAPRIKQERCKTQPWRQAGRLVPDSRARPSRSRACCRSAGDSNSPDRVFHPTNGKVTPESKFPESFRRSSLRPLRDSRIR